MIIRVLGTVAPYSKDNKNCPGFLINNKVLLDCGNGVTRLMTFPDDLENLTVFITHFHNDHYGDLFSLADASFVYHNLGLLKGKVKVYLPEPKTKEEELIYQFIISKKTNYMEYITYNDTTKLDIDEIEISFYQTKHDITCYASKLKDSNNTLVYSSDTGYDNKFIDYCHNSNILICESTFLSNQKKNNINHLSSKEAGKIAKLANVGNLVLTHFWPEIDKKIYVEEARQEFDNVIGAEENKILKLGGIYGRQ